MVLQRGKWDPGDKKAAPWSIVASCSAQQCLPCTMCPGRCCAQVMFSSHLYHSHIHLCKEWFILKANPCWMNPCPKLPQKCWRMGGGERLELVVVAAPHYHPASNEWSAPTSADHTSCRSEAGILGWSSTGTGPSQTL